MTPRKELDDYIAQGDIWSILCQKGIDFMYWVSHVTGYSYEQVNIFILYILTPCIIASISIASYICYMKFAHSVKDIPKIFKYCAYGWSAFLIFDCLYMLNKYIRYIMKQDWTVFCHEQIQTIFDTEHLDYGTENIMIFIIMPLIAIAFPVAAMIFMRIFKGNKIAFFAFSSYAKCGVFGGYTMIYHLDHLLPPVF